MSTTSGAVKSLVAGLCAAVLATSAQAQFLTSTGQLSSGGLDSRWQISTDNGGAWTAASLVTNPPGVWAAVPGGSWISVNASGSGGNGNYRVRQQFTLGAGASLSFTMTCAVDNTFLGLFINGTQVGNGSNTCATFSMGSPISFTSADFLAGLNTLELRWSGDGTTDGAAVAISNLSFVPGTPPVPGVVPEPSTYALMATGLFGLVGFARRRRNG